MHGAAPHSFCQWMLLSFQTTAMKILLAILTLGLVEMTLHAETLAQMAAESAEISVDRMMKTPLITTPGEKNWLQVPTSLTKFKAQIFTPLKDQEGQADIVVIKDGFMLLACNYADQGSDLGNWRAHVTDQTGMEKKGWQVLTEHELGGKLVQGDHRVQVIFYKKVIRGEHFILRCNKYDPPYEIVLQR